MKTPKEDGFYMPAEWFPHAGCWMAWPCHHETWENIGLEKAEKAFAELALAIAEYEPVTMLVRPEDKEKAEKLCSDKIKFMPLALNDSWTRDTGCSFLVNKQGELAGVDWVHNAWGGNYLDYALDNKIAKAMIDATGAKYYSAPLVMEGGSFHTDGEGTILTTRECLLNPNRNFKLSQSQIEQYLKDFLNIEKIIWLNQGLVGDETDGHIDEIATFIGPATVLCLITEDKNDENYHRLQENLAILKTAVDAKSRPLRVFTIEQPPATYLKQERLTLSYINFYHANKGIIMPAFGYPKYDRAAYELFVKIFPNYKISQLAARNIFAGGGGIHCVTQQQPVNIKNL